MTKYHTNSSMLCSADEAQLMRLLIQLIKAKKVIEIGKRNIMAVKC